MEIPTEKIDAIVTAYEECGYTPERLARKFKLEQGVVEEILKGNSLEYQKYLRVTSTEKLPLGTHSRDVSIQDFLTANKVFRELLDSENELVRFKVAKELRDEFRGRLQGQIAQNKQASDAENVKELMVNINQALAFARKEKEKVLQEGEVIDV